MSSDNRNIAKNYMKQFERVTSLAMFQGDSVKPKHIATYFRIVSTGIHIYTEDYKHIEYLFDY